MLSPQPSAHCGNCQAPIYWIRGEYRFTCLCIIGTATHTYAIETRECGIFFQPGRPPEMPPIAPQSLSESQTCEREEINHARALKVYQELYKAIYHHMATCDDCGSFGEFGMECPDQMIRWRSLRWWGKRLMTEEKPAC